MPDEDGEIDHTDYEEATLNDLTVDELKDLAKEKNIKNVSKMKKEELIKALEDNE
jgi:predicted GIY-YIG superfamily endonuclease